MQTLSVIVALAGIFVSHVSAQDVQSELSLTERYLEVMKQMVRFDMTLFAEQEQEGLVPHAETERVSGRLSSSAPQTGQLTITIDGRDVEFSDVPLSSWFAPYVRSAIEAELLSGYRDAAGIPTGVFGPQNNVTIAELAKIAVLAADNNLAFCGKPLNEKARNQWYSDVIACAEKNKWVLFSDGTIDPMRPALRAEVIVTLLQALDVRLSPLGETGPFKDVQPSTQFSAAISEAKTDGIIRGYTDASGIPTGFFGPTDPVTRAETAKILILSVDEYK